MRFSRLLPGKIETEEIASLGNQSRLAGKRRESQIVNAASGAYDYNDETLSRRPPGGSRSMQVFRAEIVAIAAAMLAVDRLPADAGDVTVRSVETWSTAFGGQDATYHFIVESPQRIDARGTWTLSVKERVLARGTIQAQVRPDSPAQVEIRLKLPEARPDLTVPLSLDIAIDDAGASAKLTKSLWLFPEDPFVDRQQWLKGLKLVLFDPAKTTADLFRKAKIPFEETRDPGGVREGVLVVGEGTSFREFRQLSRQLIDAAGRGVSVLCLAPESGAAPLPLARGGDGPQPTRLVFGGTEMISQFDKRLDAVSWPPDGSIVASSVVVSGQRTGIEAPVERSTKGWPWIEADFDNNGGKFVICGFAIVKKWDSGPTPRFLFERILHHLNRNSADNQSGDRGDITSRISD